MHIQLAIMHRFMRHGVIAGIRNFSKVFRMAPDTAVRVIKNRYGVVILRRNEA